MRTAGQLQDLSSRLVSLSQSLVSHEYVRAEGIARIKASEGRTQDWIAAELAKYADISAIRALKAQVDILEADIQPEREAWENPAAVLRLAAMPQGATSDAAAVQGLLQAEAKALEADPAALQRAIMDAATSKDWPRLFALSLGRLDSNGSPLPAFKDSLQGIRFDCLDLPGQESAMESLHAARVATLDAGLAWSRAKGEAENYTHRSLLTRAAADHERAKRDRRARLMLTPGEALKRAALEAVEPSSRYTKLPSQPGQYGIYDTLTGNSRIVDEASGPALLHSLNHPVEEVK